MKPLAILYILNATLLLLHEVESAYWKEWEILKWPRGLTGFLSLHIPIILILLIGVYPVAGQTRWGAAIAGLTGIGGALPFLVHKILVRKEGAFDSAMSNAVIYLNLLTGLATAGLSAVLILGK